MRTMQEIPSIREVKSTESDMNFSHIRDNRATGCQILVIVIDPRHPFLVRGHVIPTHLYPEDGSTVLLRNAFISLPGIHGIILDYHDLNNGWLIRTAIECFVPLNAVELLTRNADSISTAAVAAEVWRCRALQHTARISLWACALPKYSCCDT
jgi:hypothetical protein